MGGGRDSKLDTNCFNMEADSPICSRAVLRTLSSYPFIYKCELNFYINNYHRWRANARFQSKFSHVFTIPLLDTYNIWPATRVIILRRPMLINWSASDSCHCFNWSSMSERVISLPPIWDTINAKLWSPK